VRCCGHLQRWQSFGRRGNDSGSLGHAIFNSRAECRPRNHSGG
jgi:hypothetical protein